MSEPLRFAVLLKDPAARMAPGVLAQALAPVLGRPPHDLAAPLRRAWGVIAGDEEEARAKVLVEALAKAGAAAVAVPRSLLETPPPAEPLRALEPGGARIALLAAAAFRATTTRVVTEEQGPNAAERAIKIGLTLATGLPLGFGSKKTVHKTVSASDLVYFLDVYVGEPLRRLRIDAQDFDYSCLGQRMGYDAPGNFRRLLELLGPRAARLNAGARGILEGKPVRDFGYDSLADLDSEGRWLLTLSALKL